jgi:hypothetical protein
MKRVGIASAFHKGNPVCLPRTFASSPRLTSIALSPVIK